MIGEIFSVYSRENALNYANQWAMSRNPQYFDYSDLGGDCTNFISQCIHAGGGIMDYTKDLGWYYSNANDKAPAWTSAHYLYNFLTRSTAGPGPYAKEVDVSQIEAGDIVQLAFQDTSRFSHSLFVVKCGSPASVDNILINTHTDDRKDYLVTNYFWTRIRFVKILGIRR
jgi:hypothetical protein